MSALYQLVRADLLERARRPSFVTTMVVTLFAGYLLVPPADAGYATLDLAGYRGLYNSAFIGTMVAMLATLFLSLIGFYLVRGTVERDRRTGVGQILAATPMRGTTYILGKAASNFAYLTMVVGLLAGAAAAMQLIRGESAGIEPWKLLAPFLILTLPAMALVAAIAVFFDAVRPLAGSFGNAVYALVVWQGLLLVAGHTGGMNEGEIKASKVDALGWTAPLADLIASCRAVYPECGLGSMGINPIAAPLELFRWDGMAWTPGFVGARLSWLGVAFAVVLAATLFFRRFDPARERSGKPGRTAVDPVPAPAVQVPAVQVASTVAWKPLPAGARDGFRILDVASAELRLMLRGRRWWLLVALGLMVGGALAPVEVGRRWLLAVAWIWPITVWSAMGCRELRHGTEQLLFSAGRPLGRQLPALWLAGFAVAVLTGGGVALRLLAAGDWGGIGAWLAGALFVPSLALCLGVWSGGGKLFELSYALLWYLGPLQQVPRLDYLGATTEAVELGMPMLYVGLAALLVASAFAGRRRQLSR